MKIIVLDGVPLNQGDLSWEELGKLGDLTVYDRTSPEEVASRITNAEAILTNKVKLGEAHFESTPNLKYVGLLATGYDNVDAKAARARGIAVCNLPSYSAAFTAQTTIALLLGLAQRLGVHAGAVAEGKWVDCPDFSFTLTPQIELDGKTLVVVGLGNIGRRVARIAEALGMRVLAAQLPGRPRTSEHDRIPLDDALPQADVVTFHCPLTQNTRGFVNDDFIAKMKPTAFLINTARGALLDEAAVARALAEGRIAGFAGDTLSVEPPRSDNPLLSAPNAIITPHLAWTSLETRSRCLDLAVANLKAFLDGTPQNLVN